MISWKAHVSCTEISCCPIDYLSCQRWAMLQTFGFRPERRNTGCFSQLVQGNQIPHLSSSHVQKCGVVKTSGFFISVIQSHFWWRQPSCCLNYVVWAISSWAPRRSQEQQWSRDVFWLKSEGRQPPGLNFRESVYSQRTILSFSQFPPISTLEALWYRCGSHQHIKEFELLGSCWNILVFTHQKNFTSE